MILVRLVGDFTDDLARGIKKVAVYLTEALVDAGHPSYGQT